MILNLLKQWFWCGVFHDRHLVQWGEEFVVCMKCGTEFEVEGR